MLSFSNWLLAESKMILNTAPGLESHRGQALHALTTYLNRYGGPEHKSASSRFSYFLEKVREGYSEKILQFRYAPIENRRASDEIASPDDYRREFYPADWDGKTGKRIYPTPKDAVESIPERAELAWRGMSWEEWKLTRSRGFVQSMGHYNFTNQAGLTFYGPDPNTGISYASGFAPIAFTVTPKRPGIVIGVSRSNLKDHTQNPGIPAGELAHEGPLPLSHVVEVYMLVATKGKPGTLELIIRNDGKISEGSRSDASIGYAIRRIQ
jgi:hypothetical protein